MLIKTNGGRFEAETSLPWAGTTTASFFLRAPIVGEMFVERIGRAEGEPWAHSWRTESGARVVRVGVLKITLG